MPSREVKTTLEKNAGFGLALSLGIAIGVPVGIAAFEYVWSKDAIGNQDEFESESESESESEIAEHPNPSCRHRINRNYGIRRYWSPSWHVRSRISLSDLFTLTIQGLAFYGVTDEKNLSFVFSGSARGRRRHPCFCWAT